MLPIKNNEDFKSFNEKLLLFINANGSMPKLVRIIGLNDDTDNKFEIAIADFKFMLVRKVAYTRNAIYIRCYEIEEDIVGKKKFEAIDNCEIVIADEIICFVKSERLILPQRIFWEIYGQLIEYIKNKEINLKVVENPRT